MIIYFKKVLPYIFFGATLFYVKINDYLQTLHWASLLSKLFLREVLIGALGVWKYSRINYFPANLTLVMKQICAFTNEA